MLVGSNAHRGPHRIRAWMPSLAHYCFLDDPRTQRVLCEPNEKNTKIIEVRFRFCPCWRSCRGADERRLAPLVAVPRVDRLQAPRQCHVPAQDVGAHDPRQERVLRPVPILDCLARFSLLAAPSVIVRVIDIHSCLYSHALCL